MTINRVTFEVCFSPIRHWRTPQEPRDRDLFMPIMENPPELQGNLKTAIKKYRDKYGQ